MSKLFFTFFLLVLPLAGCQTAKPIADVQTAVATDPNVKGSDVLSARRDAGEDVPELRGTNLLTVRAYHRTQKTPKSNFRKVEFEGVSCEVSSDGFKVSVTTPGQVRVPDYGYASRLVSVKCSQEGYKNGFKNVQAYDVNKQGRRSVAASGGLLAIVAIEIINAADDKKNNDFAYPEAHVYMNRVGCAEEKPGCRNK